MSDRKGRDGPWAPYPQDHFETPLQQQREASATQHVRLQNAAETRLFLRSRMHVITCNSHLHMEID